MRADLPSIRAFRCFPPPPPDALVALDTLGKSVIGDGRHRLGLPSLHEMLGISRKARIHGDRQTGSYG
jgi:hypothetical protein